MRREGAPAPWVRLSVLFLTVFVDLVGFGIVLPLLPFYADRFGASGTQIAVLVFSYSAAQFLLAPIWGRLSDRYGRRPILIIGLVGSGVSYLVFAYAGSILALLASRVMAGVGGANIPVAQAYIADITPPARRAGGMGLIGAAFGLGFIFGPALGGLLAPMSPAAPGLAAAGLCFTNALCRPVFPSGVPVRRSGTRAFASGPAPGSSPPGGPPGPAEPRVPQGRGPVLPLHRRLCIAIHPIFPLFAAQPVRPGRAGSGLGLCLHGNVSGLMQGVVVRILAPRIGEAGPRTPLRASLRGWARPRWPGPRISLLLGGSSSWRWDLAGPSRPW
jgi:MFS family permease